MEFLEMKMRICEMKNTLYGIKKKIRRLQKKRPVNLEEQQQNLYAYGA